MLLVVIALFLAGWLCQSRLTISPGVLRWGDRYVLHLALPAVIVSKVSRMELTHESGIPIVVAWGSMLLCAVVLLLVSRRLAWSPQQTGALMLVGVLGNTSFLGIEVVRSLLGEDYVAAAVTYDQLGTFLALTLYGSWAAARYGSGQSGWRPIVSRMSRFTPFLALIVSVGLRSVALPSAFISTLDTVGLTVAPVAMCVLGLRFTLRWNSHIKQIVLGALALKMLVVPIVVLVTGLTLGDIHSVVWSASFLQSAAPPMVTAGVVAVAAGCDEDLVVSIVGLGTLVSFVTLPLFSLIL